MTALLAWWENINKYKQSKNCHYQWNHFSSFVIYINAMLGREAWVSLKVLKESHTIEVAEYVTALHLEREPDFSW